MNNILFPIALALGSTVEPARTPAPTCCDSPQAIVESYFAGISGERGARDWKNLQQLLLPDTQLSAIGINESGENELFAQTAHEYFHHLGEYLKAQGFHQNEVCRSMYVFGRLAAAVSVYESRNIPDGPIIDRGVLGFHLLSDGKRWFIANVTWHSESKSAALKPSAYPPDCNPVKRGGAA